jgi:two-component system OmpR family response regulator
MSDGAQQGGTEPSVTSLLRSLPQVSRADGTPIRLLVLEDEAAIADLVRLPLAMLGWDVHVVGDGLEAVRRARELRPDALVLDRMVPGIDGLTALERIRAFQPEVPALLLTAMDAPLERVGGLAAGADDYVTKPFTVEEVVFRLHRLVQRSGAVAADDDQLVVGDLVMDRARHEVRRGGDLVELTATQYQVLEYLMENPDRVLSKSLILEKVWNYDFGGRDNVVEMYVSYLRKKIDAGREPMIHTVRGAGYRLRAAP